LTIGLFLLAAWVAWWEIVIIISFIVWFIKGIVWLIAALARKRGAGGGGGGRRLAGPPQLEGAEMATGSRPGDVRSIQPPNMVSGIYVPVPELDDWYVRSVKEESGGGGSYG
jgi:hypothetical protein